MTRVNNPDVASYWRCGEPASNSTGAFWTDGDKIYSYRLCIGTTGPGGEKIARLYRSGTKYGFQSMTTSKHVGYVYGSSTHSDCGTELKVNS